MAEGAVDFIKTETPADFLDGHTTILPICLVEAQVRLSNWFYSILSSVN